ncbi:suppressor of fused domain protein [Pyxidicoccus xibeiensis]|uniref:suppressor of fused domain protein n=1 Tax=Pyxidicoccus xibeiensis TaxID=2906759 RepID=UPI0020A7916E|nr:suppressor of fused domain protein [Pyxidicoccus xibeiensis]MCP3143001.1 suppressor of fused domain protein [Pyxidicoccus xibeiensis]
MHDELLSQVCDAREKVYRTLGELDGDVMTPLINPAFMGGPRWPSLRQGWRIIRRGGTTLMVSDGLSDPFDDEEAPSVGFGLELIIETDEPLDGNVAASWPFQLVTGMSQYAASTGRMLELLERYGAISSELPMSGLSEEQEARWLNDAQRVGIIIGVPAKTLPSIIPTPAGDVRLATVKPLLREELEYLIKNGGAGRTELANRFAALPDGHVARLNRSSGL